MNEPAVRIGDDGRTLHVNGKPIPWAILTKRQVPMRSCEFRYRQALIPFENGWQVSIVWGSGTYSDNHDFDGPFTETPVLVEVAVLNCEGLTETPDCDTVLGYATGEQVLELIEVVATWHTGRPEPWPDVWRVKPT